MSEKIHSAHKTADEGEFQLPQVVSRQGAGVWSQENMQAVPLLKPVSAQGRISTQVLNLKVNDSKKRIRLQDREDVAMEEENGSSTS
jgi:hypothetical protein